MKRRVIKISDRRYRVELPGGDVSQFSYREKPRKWITAKYSYADFEPDEDRYTLSWEGLFLDTFRTEIMPSSSLSGLDIALRIPT